ncbi:MAG: hypothetical protein WDM94_08445 [Bauldia sp.]
MIQIVCIKWGAKYGIDAVNRIHRTVRRQTGAPVRFVLIADSVDGGLDPEIEVKPFPPFPVPFDLLKQGCRLKLAMFAPGLLDPDLPTIYFDLDTVIRGDVQRIADQLDRTRALYMLQNHYVQFWRYQSLLKLIGSELFYYGNSSVLAFHPGRFGFIYEKFCELISTAPRDSLPRQMKSDERFMSWAAQGQVRVFPRSLAVKFAEEYMAPWTIVEDVRSRLPWVARRRENLVAITFVGGALKPSELAKLKKGDILRYRHFRYRWQPDAFRDYWDVST